MIVSQFQSWAETASLPSRADGVSALARAFLYSNLDAQQSREAVRALTGFLDDPSPLVRRALADAFASAGDAPHHIVLALAEDQSGIAAIVLSRSPILSDAELIDCAAGADDFAQSAIASRSQVSAPVAAALAEVGAPKALAILAANSGAMLTDATIKRMIERHGSDGALREALLERGALSLALRAELVSATAGALGAFVMGQGWLSAERAKRVLRESTDKATITIAASLESDEDEIEMLAAHLRETGQLTVSLALRALLSGNRRLFNATLSDLSGMGATRVEGLTRYPQSAGFAALYRKAGFPIALMPAFRLALTTLLRDGYDVEESHSGLSMPLIAEVIGVCAATNEGQFDKLLMVLRRFEAEAARDEARASRSDRRALSPLIDVPVPLFASRLDQEERLLATMDFDEAVPAGRSLALSQSARFTIDLAAIEAELVAA